MTYNNDYRCSDSPALRKRCNFSFYITHEDNATHNDDNGGRGDWTHEGNGRRQTARSADEIFKTAPGEYGEGDEFLGIRVPQTRRVVAEAADMPLKETEELIYSPWHEIRLCGFLILTEKMRRLTLRRALDDPESMEKRENLVRFYLNHTHQANNWDLVDLSADKITGRWLTTPSISTEEEKTAVMDRLADSSCMWEQRIAMVSTIEPTRQGDFRYVLRYAEKLKKHPHDLMHKAVGWMLREMGKRDMNILRAFLSQNYADMSRTSLRYAIERMEEDERRQWLTMQP